MTRGPRTLVAGTASGPAVVLEEPLSFWGGLDPATGRIVDPHHAAYGVSVTAAVLVMPSGRGSSSSSTVFAEAVRAGTAPVAIILREPDAIVALGAIVARELYGIDVPVVVTGMSIEGGCRVTVSATAGAARIDTV